MTNPQPTGKFTLPIVLNARKVNSQLSHKHNGLVLDLFYDVHGNVVRIEMSGTVEQLMKEITQNQ